MRLLFSAPLDFDPRVMQDYYKSFTLATSPAEAEVWVCDPLMDYEQ